MTHSPLRLISFPVSHYCEKVRWTLELLDIPYVEERHVPIFHWLYTKPLGGSSVPVLVTEDAILTDSAQIMRHIAQMTSNNQLYPAPLRGEIDKLERIFNTELAPCVRCWAYFYLLNQFTLMKQLWCEGTPRLEQSLFPLVFPTARRMARKAYQITPDRALDAFNRIQGVFRMVEKRLADSRAYLIGNDFSAADLTFASLAAPAVLANGYGVKLPLLDELPPKMSEQVKVLQETDAGKYVLRLYREKQQM